MLDQFKLSRERVETLITRMNKSMNNGLVGNPNSLKMINTFIQAIPDGSEEGDFFALDLGGTNFRVLLVKLHNKEVKMSHQIYTIAEEIRNGGTADALFGYIAECLAKFVKQELGADARKINTVGFTFSFPVDQNSLSSGVLMEWTKGFDVSGVEREDVVELLMEAIKKRNEIEVEQIALLNDTSGVMMSCAYNDPDVIVGMILGTGSNACYLGPIDIDFYNNYTPTEDTRYAIINTEWGAFGDWGELKDIDTPYDQTVDKESLYPGKQQFEKKISGMYLGEIVRQCILSLIKEYVLFAGRTTPELNKKDSFTTLYVSDFCSGDAMSCIKILHKLGYQTATLEDCLVIQEICVAVSLRAARLSAAGLTCIIRRLEKRSLSVAMDGSLYKKHPTFKRFMHQALEEFAPTTLVNIRLAHDGSGIGAAVVAAVAQRLSRQSSEK